MSLKSVLDVEVNASAFERYQQLFNKYQDNLTKHPGFWKSISKETASASGSFNRMAAAAQAQARVQRELSEVYKTQNQHLMQGERLWGTMSRHATSIASTILRATRSLISWSGLVGAAGGLLGAGSLFGIDRMARTANDSRRSSMGLGMTIGEQRAFQINFGRVVDPDAFLGWINAMETDPRKAASAAALGVGLTQNTGRDAVGMLRALRARAQSTPLAQLGMLPGMFGLEGVSGEDLRRLRTMSGKEFEGLVSGNARDVNKLNIQDKTAEKWADFVNMLDRAKSSIFATLVQGLAPLAGPLGHLSGAFEKFISTLLKSDVVKHAIDGFAGWLEKFSGSLGSSEFIERVRRFTSDVGDLADAFHTVMHPINSIENWANSDTGGTPKAAKQRFSSQLSTLEENSGLPKGMLGYQFMKESGGMFNPPDNKGHVGAFQFDPNTAKWLNKLYRKHLDPRKPGEAAILASYYDDWLVRHYKGDVKSALGAYNWGPENMDAYLKTGKGARGQPMPAETRDYMGNAQVSGSGSNVTITVVNATGGSAAVIASQLAH